MLVRGLGVAVQREAGSEYGPQERSVDGDCHLEVISRWWWLKSWHGEVTHGKEC